MSPVNKRRILPGGSEFDVTKPFSAKVSDSRAAAEMDA
jgi:hypothetical protein